jgi:iron(III) transport system substrate-binding protein
MESKNRLIIGVIALVIIAGVGYSLLSQPSAPEEVPDTSPVEVPETPAEDVHITVYCSTPGLANGLEEAFEAEHGDVLTVVSGAWCRKLLTEIEAGEVVADVIYGAEPVYYNKLIKFDALMEYDGEYENLKDEFDTDDTYFTLANGRYGVIIYNGNMVDTPPETWEDLTSSEYSGLVALPNAATCATAYAIVGGFVNNENYGWEYITALKENGVLLVDTGGNVPKTVASGEAIVGIAPVDASIRMINAAKKEGVESPLRIVWPEEGVVSIARPIAIIQDESRSEANTELAQQFVDFVMTAQAQTIGVKQGFIPSLIGVNSPAGVPDEINLIPVDWAFVLSNEVQIKDSFEQLMAEE